MYIKIIKPLADFIASICALIIFSPILLFTTILLYVKNDGKPFFFQHRPGKNGKIFNILKFRTMNDTCDAEGNLLPDYERLHKIGIIIRKLSIDELLQLINVAKGDMSIVGPRPLLKEYLPLYSEFQQQRHLVKPGITGWAQVNGRNTITWVHKFELDVYYVENISFLLDIKIVFKTILRVLRMSGVDQAENETMEDFKGEH
jgi:undecaprenyl phosphate N,N'-diacetylbacillosamine 1-phosphate transferase